MRENDPYVLWENLTLAFYRVKHDFRVLCRERVALIWDTFWHPTEPPPKFWIRGWLRRISKYSRLLVTVLEISCSCRDSDLCKCTVKITSKHQSRSSKSTAGTFSKLWYVYQCTFWASWIVWFFSPVYCQTIVRARHQSVNPLCLLGLKHTSCVWENATLMWNATVTFYDFGRDFHLWRCELHLVVLKRDGKCWKVPNVILVWEGRGFPKHRVLSTDWAPRFASRIPDIKWYIKRPLIFQKSNHLTVLYSWASRSRLRKLSKVSSSSSSKIINCCKGF